MLIFSSETASLERAFTDPVKQLSSFQFVTGNTGSCVGHTQSFHFFKDSACWHLWQSFYPQTSCNLEICPIMVSGRDFSFVYSRFFFWREGDTSSFFIAKNRFSGHNIWHFMHAEMTRENLLSRIPTSNHCHPLSVFSEVHPFTARMVQKTFEINLKHAARSVLFPPLCSFLVWHCCMSCISGRVYNQPCSRRTHNFRSGAQKPVSAFPCPLSSTQSLSKWTAMACKRMQ